MAVNTTLSLTERHNGFLLAKVREGIFATRSAVVAAAVEQMIQDEAEREVALSALADEIRERVHTPRSDYVGQERAFSSARATIDAARSRELPNPLPPAGRTGPRTSAAGEGVV